MNDPGDRESGAVPRPDGAEDIITSAMRMLHDLDDTSLSNMTPLFYQHGFEELNMAVRDLLRLLGHDPDA